ncbi:MAG TPA: zinc metalloprotease HtpX [Bacteroidota bacterium]
MNTLKTTLLMTVLTVLLVFAGSLIGGNNGMMFAFVIALAMNFGSYWFSDKIVLAMYGAKEITREQNPPIFEIVQDLTTRAGLPMPRIYMIQSEQPNAFATGRDPQHAAVAVTEGIMQLMPKNEIRGVIAHELAHVKHRDILISSIAATMAGAITMLANMAQWAMIFGGFGGRSSRDDEGSNPIAALVMIIVAPLAAMMVQMAISRSREYDADKGGAEISGDPMALAHALRRLETAKNEIPMKATPATAHMFIINPLSGKAFMNMFSTHPPIEDRIARLEEMAKGKAIG